MKNNQTKMSARIEKWIDAGHEPGIAHWHGALEATMDSFKPLLSPGRLMPVHPPERSAGSIFEELYTFLDLNPELETAFFPTAMGGVLAPPAALDNLRRVNQDNVSMLLLCRRPGNPSRILCAEISPEAWKPGADLFETGALLGSYEYDCSADCIHDLPKLVRTHLWRKEKWTAAHHADYTLNWFARVVDTGRPDAPVQPDFSYVHRPVLLNLDTVGAVFKLIYAMADRQFKEEIEIFRSQAGADCDTGADKEDRRRFLEGRVLDMLNLLRDSRAVDFAALGPRENEQFKDGFTATVKRLDALLEESL